MEKEQFFDFLLKHLKLRLSVWLGKPELIGWHSLCKAGNVLQGASLSNALQMGKHTLLEICGKKHSSACAVLKGTAGHNMWERQINVNYWLAPGFEGTPGITSQCFKASTLPRALLTKSERKLSPHMFLTRFLDISSESTVLVLC